MGGSRSRAGASWWRRKEELVELAFLASFGSEQGDTLDSPAHSLCLDWGEWEAPGHGWFGGGRDTVGGRCRTDVLVRGPTSSPEKARGENTSVLLVQATHRTCQGSGFDFEITRLGSVCRRAEVCVQTGPTWFISSSQSQFRAMNAGTHRQGCSHTQPFLAPTAALLCVTVLEGREATRFADSQSILEKNEAAGLKFVKETAARRVVCSVSAFRGGTDRSSIGHALPMRGTWASLTVTDFRVASGILGKCVWVLTPV